MSVSDIDAVCRSEAQRVLTALRGNRRFGDLSRGWRELEEDSPVRELAEWRYGCRRHGASAPSSSHTANGSAAELLKPLLRIVKSPDFGGPATCVSLEAIRGVLIAIGGGESGVAIASVVDAVCDCAFEETDKQTDEAAAMQMIEVLGHCCTTTSVPNADAASVDGEVLTTQARMRAFAKVVSLWNHYKSPTLRAGAQDTLQSMLDWACCRSATLHGEQFLRLVFDSISSEVGPQLPQDTAKLYLRCLQRLALAPSAAKPLDLGGPPAWVLQEAVPASLASIGDHFGTSVSVLSLLLPTVNRICWLSADRWTRDMADSGAGAGLGALQVEALIGRTYIRTLSRAVAPLRPRTQSPAGDVAASAAEKDAALTALSVEEGAELLVVLLENLCDLFQPGFVWTLWSSFDADWRRPPLLEEVLLAIISLFEDGPSSERERPLPAYVEHLSAAVLARVVAAFAEDRREEGGDAEEAYRYLRAQWDRREELRRLMALIEEKPKKTRASVEKSGLLDFVELPISCTPASASTQKSTDNGVMAQPRQHEDWAVKLAWILRCCNAFLPFAAVGEFFGQPTEDSERAFEAFCDTFDMGEETIEVALRSFLQAFLLPKEAQQIDRVLKIFAHTYYRQHVQKCSNTYLRAEDAAYTLAFSCILLNSDQHNPKLKKRMALKDFLRNNQGINEGENIPEEVQERIFESIKQDEIKTPDSGSFVDGFSRARLQDLAQLAERGYRDNKLACSSRTPWSSSAHARGFVERTGSRLRTTFETMLAADPAAHGDAALGLEELMQLSLDQAVPEVDKVAETLFFFGIEAFHEPQQRVGAAIGRASLCLRALFRSSLRQLGRLSIRQTHMLVYVTVQFVLYGLGEQLLPKGDEELAIVRLLRIPSLVVDPPTGAVYSFLRKISGVPFRMLSAELESSRCLGGGKEATTEDPTAEARENPSASSFGSEAPDGSDSAQAAELATPKTPVGAATSTSDTGTAAAVAMPPTSTSPGPAPSSSQGATSFGAGLLKAARVVAEDSAEDEEVPSNGDAVRPQIRNSLEVCAFETLLCALVEPWNLAASQLPADAVLSFLSPLFLALRTPSTPKLVNTEDVMPWWPDVETRPECGQPQALQLPKRTLALNVLDGYDVLRLALRLTTLTIRRQWCLAVPSVQWSPSVMQELCVAAHAGLFYTLRRPDLAERTLRLGIVCVFQLGVAFLGTWTPQGPLISVGWPVKLLEVLVRRCEGEPQFLVSVGKLCLESVRWFVCEVVRCRCLRQVLVWQRLLQLLLKAIPTSSRALWPNTKDVAVAALQGQLWREGIVWVLGHPSLLECVGADDAAASDKGPAATADASASSPAASEGDAFWTWALGELAAPIEEMYPGNRRESSKFLLGIYKALLGNIIQSTSTATYCQDESRSEEDSTEQTSPHPSPLPVGAAREEPDEERRAAGQAVAWTRVTLALLGLVGRMLGKKAELRPVDENGEQQLIAMLRRTMLDIRVPPVLSGSPQGPELARTTVEKLVSVLNVAAASSPLGALREAVPLVAKFFLQNLQSLQGQENFSQLWLMVLRLMCSFIKRGSEERDAELEEIATETLKNLLGVLLNTKVLGYVPAKPSKEVEGDSDGVPVWWQMTWNCIEIFLPGFGEDFARSILSSPQEVTNGTGEVDAVQSTIPAGAGDADAGFMQPASPTVAEGVGDDLARPLLESGTDLGGRHADQ